VRRRDVTPWLELDAAAALARVSRRTLYRWVQAGKLRSRRLGARTEVLRADLVPHGPSASLLDLFEPVRDREFADVLMDVWRERRSERGRRPPTL
jgi:excisionase family DNA binding protein